MWSTTPIPLWFAESFTRASIVLGLVCRDRLAGILRIVGAAQMPLASIIVLVGPRAAEVPLNWRLAYVVALAVACFAIAKIWRSRWYLYSFTSLLAIAGYGATALGFRGAVTLLGRAATTSFAWSFAALLLALLISAQKAHWLPPRLFPRWGNGRGGAGPAGVPDTSIKPSEQSPGPSI